MYGMGERTLTYCVYMFCIRASFSHKMNKSQRRARKEFTYIVTTLNRVNALKFDLCERISHPPRRECRDQPDTMVPGVDCAAPADDLSERTAAGHRHAEDDFFAVKLVEGHRMRLLSSQRFLGRFS